MGFFSGRTQSSQSDAFSGLRAKDNMGSFNALLSRTPGDYDYLFSNLRDRAMNNNILNLNSQGLMPEQMAGVNALGSKLFSNVSGNYAAMGLNRPENINAVVGGALTQAAPQLMGLASQNVLGNQALQSDRFAQLLSLFSQTPGLLGSESHSQGQARDPNLLASAFANSLGNAATNWFAPNTSGSAAQSMFSGLF